MLYTIVYIDDVRDGVVGICVEQHDVPLLTSTENLTLTELVPAQLCSCMNLDIFPALQLIMINVE